MGTEKPNFMFPTVKDYFYHKRECYNAGALIKRIQVRHANDYNFSLYDLHDGKIVYLLTQYSQ